MTKHSWLESGGVYGCRKIHADLRELSERCGRHRVARLMRVEGLRSQTCYRRWPGRYDGKPATPTPNRLERQFNVSEPNKVWGTDIAYIRTYEGWLYLAVALDLFSRRVIGWSMEPRMSSDLAIYALLMAVWRRKPRQEVMIHSDQGSQFSSADWQRFIRANNLTSSMSHPANIMPTQSPRAFSKCSSASRSSAASTRAAAKHGAMYSTTPSDDIVSPRSYRR